MVEDGERKRIDQTASGKGVKGNFNGGDEQERKDRGAVPQRGK